MKRVLTFILVLIACCQAFGQGVPSDATPRLMIDGAGTLIDSSNPLPVNALVTIGSVTVDPAAPVSANSTTVLSVTSSAQSVASLANRKSINFFNHSDSVTVWVSLDSAVASAAVGVGIPVFPYGYAGFELDSEKVAGAICGGVASLTVYQDGY